ncbi:amino acid ABC transporter substrate-binding protein [Streptomyces sp. NPDC002855]|uniref:ABC transporter substrate-binding protein n=1 Tax=Streptomyces sp. NPDC002855 TaxID=3154437 RepID=UPI00332CAA9E
MLQSAADWLHEQLWNTLLKKIITCAVAALLAFGTYVLVSRLTEGAGSCADGVTESGGECIGVNGSGYDFGEPEIAPVAARIAEENRRIDEQPHVTVAMMLPLQPDSRAERRQLRSELQGAFLAQYRANREPGKPVVRLVLANPGKDFLRQDEVVPDLVRMARSERDNLRAVTGFNLSLDATREAVHSLTEQQVPVLVARASASTLANRESKDGTYDFKGLARIIPTNEEQARALAAYNGSRKDRQTVLVRDTRPDPYVRSLARAFQRLPEDGPPGPDDMTFTSPGVADPGDVDNQFRPTVNTICNSGADTVYFAGRSTHLRLFLKRLAKEACAERRFTVVSGSDAASLNNRMTDADWAELRDSSGTPRLTVQYAAPAHPDSWRTEVREWQKREENRTGKKPPASKAPGSLRDPMAELAGLEATVTALKAADRDIGEVQLGDSRTMMVHDGVRTAVEAIRGAKPTGQPTPSAEQVGNRWATMQSKNRVNGTSGRICLTKAGNPYDKPLAVVELKPGTKAGPGTLEFVGLAWPTGRPQPEDCVVRGG